jgi:hypothetical protein
MGRGNLEKLETPLTSPSLPFRSGVDIVTTADDTEAPQQGEKDNPNDCLSDQRTFHCAVRGA